MCHVGPYPARGGGIASVTRMLVERQQADGDLAVDTITTSVDGGRVAKLIAFLRAIKSTRAVDNARADLVLHIHTSYGSSFGRKERLIGVAVRRGIPVLLHIHGSEFDKWYEARAPARRRQIRGRLDSVGRIVVVSDSWNEYVSSLTRTPVTTIHNAVDCERFATQRNFGAASEFLMLFLGGVGLRRKGAFDLLEAVHELSQANPDASLRLIIAGHGEIDEARSWIAARGLADRVEIPGFIDRERTDRLLNRANAFVLPSYHEGLPIALLEAMASSLPIVVSPVGGIPEAIRDDVNGLLVEPGDVAGLRDALQRLLSEPALRERLGNEARATVERQFDLGKAATRFKDIYRELLSGAAA